MEKVSGTFSWKRCQEPFQRAADVLGLPAMGRPLRVDVGGYVYHALNRASARALLFDGAADYQLFEHVLQEAQARTAIRILAYSLMPSHWHLALWPAADGGLGRFMTWLTLTHSQRWHARRGSAGAGHLYQGRYKSFLVPTDEHLLTVCRYVERNPLRAGLVRRAEAWRWASLWRRERGRGLELLSDWPIARPADWRRFVNRAETAAELEALRASAQRGRPFGAAPWRDDMVRRFALDSTLRPRGRPKGNREKGS
jgi:REP-associated tyrosine transposase